jgi:lipopolysaccharide export system permease protein
MRRILSRYIARRFLAATAAVFLGIFVLVVLVDYIELTRRASNVGNVPAWLVAVTSLYRVPQITERLLPFSVLVGAMVAYLNLSRRNELVIARAAGLSAWQFVTPAVGMALVVGVFAATVYNPLASTLGEQAKRLEESIFGHQADDGGERFWVRQQTGDRQSILHAASSRNQGESLAGVTVFLFDKTGGFEQRIEADKATLEPGRWRLEKARIYTTTSPPREVSPYFLQTNLSKADILESLSTPDTVSFWYLPQYIRLAERAGLGAAGFRFQYQSLLARPFFLAGMVLLAASVSLRSFRSGGVQRMILGGVTAGFLLYVLAKVTEDLSTAALMHPVIAAWLPAGVGALIGILTLLYQEDG